MSGYIRGIAIFAVTCLALIESAEAQTFYNPDQNFSGFKFYQVHTGKFFGVRGSSSQILVLQTSSYTLNVVIDQLGFTRTVNTIGRTIQTHEEITIGLMCKNTGVIHYYGLINGYYTASCRVRFITVLDPLRFQKPIIESLYKDILGRSSDPGGLAFWASQLKNGMTLNDIRAAFAYSPESDSNIRGIYLSVLGRQPNDAELNYFKAHLLTGTLASVRSQVENSPERVSQLLNKTSCEITVKYCPNHPSVIGTFKDTYNGANGNEVVCLQRANDYLSWCNSTQPVTAKFTRGDRVVASQTVGKSVCQIRTNSCPKHPTFVGSFLDSYGSNDPAVCNQRAQQYADWCDTQEHVSSRFFKDGFLVSSANSRATSCRITVKSCPNHPEYTGNFKDGHEPANTSVGACNQRAADYYHWCGTTEPVTAQYFVFTSGFTPNVFPLASTQSSNYASNGSGNFHGRSPLQ